MLLRNIHTVAWFTRYLDAHQIYDVHAYFLSWPACVGLALSRLTGRSLSLSAHARDIYVEHGAIRTKADAARFITVCTREGHERLRSLLPTGCHEKLHLIYHGVDVQRIGTGAKVESGSMIVAIGRMVPKKGLEILIRAFAQLRKHVEDCQLVIVGDGPERARLVKTISTLDLEGHIELPGWLHNEAVLSLMRRAAAVVVPSVVAEDGDRDGIPNVILEAFACGVPVIAGRLSGIEEAVTDRQTGLLVSPGDVGQLAQAMKRLLGSPEMRARFSQSGREYAMEQFNLKKNVTDLARLFHPTGA